MIPLVVQAREAADRAKEQRGKEEVPELCHINHVIITMKLLSDDY